MDLQPRHYKLIEYLEAHPTKKYGVDELAKELKLSMPVLRNEIPKLVQLGYVKRKPYGRTFEYYAAKQLHKPVVTKPIEPLTVTLFKDLFLNACNPDYEPKLNKLGWSLPKSLVELTAVSLGWPGEQATCRKALSDLHEAAQTYTDILGRILATPQLWDDRLSQWLTEGLSEENLENLAELTRQGITAHGRLTPAPETATTKEQT